MIRNKTLELCIRQEGFTIPLTLFLILVLSSMAAVLGTVAKENQTRIKIEEDAGTIYYASEGMLNKMLGDMTVYGSLWDQLAQLATKPAGYTEYVPSAYSTTNGIPPCTGVACHRNLYPLGGGLLKNLGPLDGDGLIVDGSYSISQQLDYNDPPTSDLELGNLKGWAQVERLDETTPSSNTVGGSLSSSLSDGGTAKEVRFRVSAYSFKKLQGKTGVSSTVSVIQVPLS